MMRGTEIAEMPRSGGACAAADPAGVREFEFTDRDFERARTLIYQAAGISLAPAKRNMLYGRLVRRLRQIGERSFGRYLDRIESGDMAEIEMFTNALTTNLTSFFREPHHFPILAAHLNRPGVPRPLTIWCAACSTGEEAYSIAMTAVEAFGSFSPPVRIFASDVDTRVLATAEAGIYAEDQAGKLAPERRKRFFLRGTGANAGQVCVRDDLRRLIAFRRTNLLGSKWPLRGPLDAIFCRNVMIYFDRPTQFALLQRFAPLLRSDGLLFAGHSESLHHAACLFRSRGKTVYVLARPERAE
jgi:chemotaxis protein methyltransferase CheR